MMARYTDRVESHCKPVAATNGPMEVVASATIAQMLQARYCAGASLTGRLNSDARPMYSDRAILNHTHSRNCRNPEYQLSHLGIKANASGQATAQPIRTDDPRANGIASISEATAASRTRHSAGSQICKVQAADGEAPPIVVRIACKQDASIHADRFGQILCQPVRQTVETVHAHAPQYAMLISQYGAMGLLYA